MNILFISRDLAGGDLAYRLKKEGNHVKLFIEDPDQHQNLEGMVEKVYDWKKELEWVGEKGLIVFDDTGYGKIQDELRRDGYSVIGGSMGGDRLEDFRHFGQKVLALYDIKTVPSMSFVGAKDAIDFVKKNKGMWVVKQNGHVGKGFNYVGQLESGEDVIEVLKNYNRNSKNDCLLIELQKKIEGIEIGVGRYFNGKDWVGPIEMNIEHKNLCNDDLGPKTWEMGTLTWYNEDESNKIFQKTLSRLKPYLQQIDFRGDVDINCIVSKDKAYPLEITARFGWPATHLQGEIHVSPWGEFLKAVADGEDYKLKDKKGFGIVVLLATPPFPYKFKSRRYYPEGIDIFFRKELNEREMNKIHFEEVSLWKNKLYISSKTGFILHVTEMGKTVKEARNKVYSLIDNIIIPKVFYRTDIGLKFVSRDQKKLKEWGWI